MKRRDLLNALICALLLTGGLAAVLFSSGALHAQTDSDSDYADSSPRRCRSCHADIYTAWADSQHALTFDSEVFQQVWERARQSPDCLTCHNPLAETTHATGVGCGACHHTIDTTRRQAEGSSTTYHGQMGTLASAADCGTCHGADHALTYVEWEASAHNGARTVDCLSCHQSHTGGLTAASGRELCGSCHLQDVPTTNPHMHVDSGCTDCHPAPVSTDNVHMSGLETDVECVACHVVTELDHYGRYLARAGHLMDVPLVACTNCHGSLHDLLSQP